jgi:hypothetical protein
MRFRKLQPDNSAAWGRVVWSHSLRSLGTTVLLLAVAAALTGCDVKHPDRLPVFPVEGQVQVNGQPLANAFVVLHPKGASDPRLLAARGQTDQNGKFQVTTYEAGDGAPVGEYAVTVEYHPLLNQGGSYEPGPNVLPRRLASPSTTDVIVRVAASPNTLPPIDVRQ